MRRCSVVFLGIVVLGVGVASIYLELDRNLVVLMSMTKAYS